jgi:hypothetical protein
MRKSVFALCDDHNAYIGYTNGYLWNGWATPYFTLEEAQRLQANYNQNAEFPIFYDVTKDEFFYKPSADEEPYVWEGEDVQTPDGIKRLYGIGAYSHMWDELGKGSKRSLAQGVADFILEYDTYNYNDDDETRDGLVEETINELENLNTFVKVYYAMNNDYLGKGEIYARLFEALNI